MSQHEEYNYRLIFENSIQGMVLRQGERLILINQSFADMVGYSIKELMAFTGEDMLILFHPDDRPAVRARYQKILAGKNVSGQYEHRFIRKNGETGWWVAAVSIIPYGGEIAALSTYIDITERKHAEMARQASQEREQILSDIVQNSSLPLCVGYPDGRIGLSNPAFWQLTGYTKQELEAIDWVTQLTPPEWHAHEAAYLAALHRTFKPVRYEKEYIRKDGSRIPIELLVHPNLDEAGTITSYFAFVTDITERKRSEQALLEKEATLRAILNAVKESVSLVDTQGTILTINNDGANRFGKTPDALIGATAWDLFPPEIASAWHRQLEHVLTTGRFTRFEDQLGGAWYETTIYPIFDAEGHVTRVVIFTRDVTERKQVEQSELAYALEKERSQILRNFIQQVSHEFRTPLSTINTSTYMIQQTTDPDLKEHHTVTIKTQTKAIGTLVNALITMVRVDTIPALRRELIDLTNLVEMIVHARHNILKEKRLQCPVKLQVHPLIVQGHTQYIQQALECLIDNAIRFTPESGSIYITIDLAISDQDPFAMIMIADTGVGISANDLPFIFDRFFRVDKVGTTRGFGLGLSIAKAIIDQHQGFIDVDSTLGEGSTFTVYLPLA